MMRAPQTLSGQLNKNKSSLSHTSQLSLPSSIASIGNVPSGAFISNKLVPEVKANVEQFIMPANSASPYNDDRHFEFNVKIHLGSLSLFGIDGDSTWISPSAIKVYGRNQAESTLIPLLQSRKNKREGRNTGDVVYSKDTFEFNNFVSKKKNAKHGHQANESYQGSENLEVFTIHQDVSVPLRFGEIFINIDIIRERTFSSDQKYFGTLRVNLVEFGLIDNTFSEIMKNFYEWSKVFDGDQASPPQKVLKKKLILPGRKRKQETDLNLLFSEQAKTPAAYVANHEGLAHQFGLLEIELETESPITSPLITGVFSRIALRMKSVQKMKRLEYEFRNEVDLEKKYLQNPAIKDIAKALNPLCRLVRGMESILLQECESSTTFKFLLGFTFLVFNFHSFICFYLPLAIIIITYFARFRGFTLKRSLFGLENQLSERELQLNLKMILALCLWTESLPSRLNARLFWKSHFLTSKTLKASLKYAMITPIVMSYFSIRQLLVLAVWAQIIYANTLCQAILVGIGAEFKELIKMYLVQRRHRKLMQKKRQSKIRNYLESRAPRLAWATNKLASTAFFFWAVFSSLVMLFWGTSPSRFANGENMTPRAGDEDNSIPEDVCSSEEDDPKNAANFSQKKNGSIFNSRSTPKKSTSLFRHRYSTEKEKQPHSISGIRKLNYSITKKELSFSPPPRREIKQFKPFTHARQSLPPKPLVSSKPDDIYGFNWEDDKESRRGRQNQKNSSPFKLASREFLSQDLGGSEYNGEIDLRNYNVTASKGVHNLSSQSFHSLVMMESKHGSGSKKESCTGGQPSNESEPLLPAAHLSRVERNGSVRSSTGSFKNNLSRNNLFNWDLNRASMGGDSNPIEHTANFEPNGSKMTSSQREAAMFDEFR